MGAIHCRSRSSNQLPDSGLAIRLMTMLKISEIAFVGYPTQNIEKARAFYEGILGLTATMADEIEPGQWWVEYDIGTGTLALSTMWEASGQSGPTTALEVPSMDEAVTHLAGHGISFEFGPIETPVCFLGSIRDPDGNTLTIHQRKPGHPA